MAYNNPPIPWSELERRLSGRRLAPPQTGDGGDSPAWSRKRAPYVPPALPEPGTTTPYAELHCHSYFSFLDGASSPEHLAEEAARLGLSALAVTDHDGLYGVVRFAEAAAAVGLATVYGAELSVGLTVPRAGVPDPAGHHLVVIARGLEGYARLSRTISKALMDGGEKGRPVYDVSALAETSGGHWQVLTGCRKGAVPQALAHAGPDAAARELADLAQAFGRGNVAVELWDHGDPADSTRNDALAALAARAGLPTVATNNVHYATPDRQPLAAALAAVRARCSLDELEGWLPVNGGAHLRSGTEMARRFARYPGAVARAAEIGTACAFDLALVAPRLPPYPVPDGHTEMSFLRHITEQGAQRRYGPRHSPRVKGAYEQIDHELALIEQLGFPGYFLIVWDIVEFCRRGGILCQGRGSAANSAVCYAIGITNVDAVGYGLLFERFLSPERDGPPDIDLDIESDTREQAIQYVYSRYGRTNAAQVANVITYRPRGAVRDMARALGYPTGQQDAWARQIDAWGRTPRGTEIDVPDDVVALAEEVLSFPRHLGIHSGGMVICDRPVVDVCPVEWARMANRSVLQWDKDDCAAIGLVKFDLLGLGMLSALHYAIDLVRDHHGVEIDLALLPQEDAVYDMLCRADSIGVFQVESRAQMATLPRLKPRCFYDLVVEIALIRPGPIQGGSVHPYIRRRNGTEPVTFLHPLLENSLAKTLGVPLFQEQLMQMAIDVAGFTAGEADQLRSAMGSKRSREKMERIRARLYAGMAERGITGETADVIYEKLAAFANFGFPESHSVSFAYLVYASSWIKLHYPAAFCAALLNAQPMGFYSPQSLVADARRHGVTVLGPDLNASAAKATLEGPRDAPAVRLGISSVRLVGDDLAEQIAGGRPYAGMEDLASRVTVSAAQLESLATAGVFGGVGLDRRAALWSAGAVAGTRPGHLSGTVTGADAPDLPAMSALDTATADVWALGMSPDSSATEFVRPQLDELGVVTAAGLREVRHGTRVLVAGVVTHRQRPATASGTTFLNLEDETGLVNVICSVGVWQRFLRIARDAPALVIRGRLERVEGVINIVAEHFRPMPLPFTTRSRDFR
ncbi:MAG TPA: error-prone DNA polymerase [Mycobacteriales bacterium]|nr:error-prone DNA polymerase [Mycobacteriales bacterium]